MSDALEQSRDAYHRGRELMEAGDLLGAIAQLEASIALHLHYKSLELLGEALMQSGQMVRAPSLLAEVFLASGDPLTAHEVSKLALARDRTNERARPVFEATQAAYESNNQ